MNMGIRSILLLVAVVLFVLSALSISLGDIDLVSVGLAVFAAAFLVGEGGFGLKG